VVSPLVLEGERGVGGERVCSSLCRMRFFILHSSFFTPFSLPCFSDVSLIGTYMSESFISEHIESHIRVKREADGRQKGGTWEDDPNIVNLYY